MASQRDILLEKIKALRHKIEHEPDVGRRLVLQERLNDAVKAMNEYMKASQKASNLASPGSVDMKGEPQ